MRGQVEVGTGIALSLVDLSCEAPSWEGFDLRGRSKSETRMLHEGVVRTEHKLNGLHILTQRTIDKGVHCLDLVR